MSKKTNKISMVFIILALVSSFLLAGYSWFRKNKQLRTVEPFVFEIQNGETIHSIGKRLQEARIISNASFFRYYLQITKQDKKIQAGYYLISQKTDHLDSVDDLIRVLQEGKAKLVKYMIPEGYNIRKIARKLEKEGLVNANRFIELATTQGFSFQFDYLDQVKEGNLEGFLFPDTYFIAEPTEEKIIQQMLDQFESVAKESILPAIVSNKSSLRDIVTLSSIVELEAQIPEERPIIASVFYNRLQDGWKLESCSTVEYVTQKEGYVLSLEELKVDSPYNTYLYPGLPAGPIGNPGLDSILASINPSKTNYFFFAAKGDGSHAFATTLEEHNQNVAKYIP